MKKTKKKKKTCTLMSESLVEPLELSRKFCPRVPELTFSNNIAESFPVSRLQV